MPIITPLGLPDIFIVPLFAFTFSQVTLIGLWAVFSRTRLWVRLLVALGGTACLEAALDQALKREFAFMTSGAMALTVASLLIVRRFRGRPSRQADGSQPPRENPH